MLTIRKTRREGNMVYLEKMPVVYSGKCDKNNLDEMYIAPGAVGMLHRTDETKCQHCGSTQYDVKYMNRYNLIRLPWQEHDHEFGSSWWTCAGDIVDLCAMKEMT